MNTTNGTVTRTLAEHHRQMLEAESAITPQVIEQRGYYTITSAVEAQALGFSIQQAATISERYPALVIPYHGPGGTVVTYCLRPDNPRSYDDKRKHKLPDGSYPQQVNKYEMPKGAGNVLDCPPAVVAALGDPARPLVFTEGAKKADSLVAHGFNAINLNGVWGWRGTNVTQGKTALPAFDDIALNGRRCVLLFDSDVRDNDHVKSALRRFRNYLHSKGAKVIPVLLPPSDKGKTGIDDWFAAGHTAVELEQLTTYFETFVPDLGGVGKRKWTTEQYIDLFENWGYVFRMNDMNEAIEVNGNPLNDTRMDILEARLLDEAIPVNHARKSITVAANVNRYHPIRAYLQSIDYDGGDHIAALAGHFEDKEAVFMTWLERWLIGAVARVMEPTHGRYTQNFMLVLDGPQGIGKSYLAEWLCPLNRYFIEAPINPDDKDSRINLASYWIWEAGELGSVTRRADREAFKQFITIKTIKERPPYGHLPIEKPATVSFIGTVNDAGDGFLSDPTGNRRFAVATLNRINWAYPHAVDVNQVWAQAYTLYQNGEPWDLTAAESKRRDELNKVYTTEEPLESLFGSLFVVDPSQAEEAEWRLTTPEILELMGRGHEATHTGVCRRLAAVLRRAGLEQKATTRTLTGSNGREKKGRFWCGLQHRP